MSCVTAVAKSPGPDSGEDIRGRPHDLGIHAVQSLRTRPADPYFGEPTAMSCESDVHDGRVARGATGSRPAQAACDECVFNAVQ
jgi:hypothetical protein